MSIEFTGENNIPGWIALGISALTFLVYLISTFRGTIHDTEKDLRDRCNDCERDLRDCREHSSHLERQNVMLLRQVVRLRNGNGA